MDGVKVIPLESKDLFLNPDKPKSHVRQPMQVTEMEYPRGHLLSAAGNQAGMKQTDAHAYVHQDQVAAVETSTLEENL